MEGGGGHVHVKWCVNTGHILGMIHNQLQPSANLVWWWE